MRCWREETGLDIWVKHENHNPTSAFKVRGGLNLVRSLSPDERAPRRRHGQHRQPRPVDRAGLSAARASAAPCSCPTATIPTRTPPCAPSAPRVDEGGRDFDEARERCEACGRATGARYVHSANEPLLIAGVGTYALEIFEELPDVDVILVPIGGGSGACGNCLVRSALGSPTRVIGVQAANADAFARSFRSGTRVVGESAGTFAEGMATRVTFDLTFGILQQELDDLVVLTEDELAEGVRLALRATHNLAEGAGRRSAAALRSATSSPASASSR